MNVNLLRTAIVFLGLLAVGLSNFPIGWPRCC